MVVDLVAPEELERFPEAECVELLGQQVRQISLAPFEASAPAKVRLALKRADRCRAG